MNINIKEALARALETTPDNITENLSEDIYEVLSCAREVQNTKVDDHRWWDDYEAVVELEPNFFISYAYAIATGDSTPTELGWERPPISDISQVFERTVTTKVYS